MKIIRIVLVIFLGFSIAFVPVVDNEYVYAQPLENNGLDKLTLNFNNVDILDVLRLLSYKSSINIVAGPEVVGNVSVHLKDVSWEEALGVLTQANGYSYSRKGNIVIVGTFNTLKTVRQEERFLSEMDALVTQVFVLKYLDSNDVKSVIEPQLSPRGKVTILQKTAEAGWSFEAGGQEGGDVSKRRDEQVKLRSNKLVVSDIPSYMKRVRDIIGKIDKKPRQILIKARIMEIKLDDLIDIGLDVGSGVGGAQNATIQTTNTKNNSYGGNNLANQVTPSLFNPLTAAITGAFPFNSGLVLLYQQLTGQQFELILHALEENAKTNVLSAPSLLVLDGHEAIILVGTKYPILSASTIGTNDTSVTTSLDYYQEIGIQLKVVPKITDDNEINMIVHPSVTQMSGTVTANASTGQALATYPILTTREAETNISMKSGETIVIGGLMMDSYGKDEIGIPIIGDIPMIGDFFKRHTWDKEKIDLLITISAYIIGEDIARVEAAGKEKEYVMDEIVKTEQEEKKKKREEKKAAKEEKKRLKKEAKLLKKKQKEEAKLLKKRQREEERLRKQLERRNKSKKEKFQDNFAKIEDKPLEVTPENPREAEDYNPFNRLQ